jgi:hypothetical protein
MIVVTEQNDKHFLNLFYYFILAGNYFFLLVAVHKYLHSETF